MLQPGAHRETQSKRLRRRNREREKASRRVRLVGSRSNEHLYRAAILRIKFASDRLFISARLLPVSDRVYRRFAAPCSLQIRRLNARTAVVNSFNPRNSSTYWLRVEKVLRSGGTIFVADREL